MSLFNFIKRNHSQDSGSMTITITLSAAELNHLQVEAVQEGLGALTLHDYINAKLFAPTQAPRIRIMYERTKRIDRQMTQLTEVLGKMAELEPEK